MPRIYSWSPLILPICEYILLGRYDLGLETWKYTILTLPWYIYKIPWFWLLFYHLGKIYKKETFLIERKMSFKWKKVCHGWGRFFHVLLLNFYGILDSLLANSLLRLVGCLNSPSYPCSHYPLLPKKWFILESRTFYLGALPNVFLIRPHIIHSPQENILKILWKNTTR